MANKSLDPSADGINIDLGIPELKGVDTSFLLSLEPEKAVKYLEKKGYKITFNWKEMWQSAHNKAFTVAKAMNLDVLSSIRSSVETSLKEGKTFQQFKKELEPTLNKLGWWGKQYQINPNTNLPEFVQLGSVSRLRTIYETNTNVAYAVGHYQTMMDNIEDRPYWQYEAVIDPSTRHSHAELNGKVFRYDDPFWDKYYPPNDWGCRCTVRPLSKEDMTAKGLKPSNSGEYLKSKNIAPAEWSYNPGRNDFDIFTPSQRDIPFIPYLKGLVKENSDSKQLIDELPVHKVDSSLLLPPVEPKNIKNPSEAKKYIDIFLSEFGGSAGEQVIYEDKSGGVLTITERLFLQNKNDPQSFKVFKNGREQYLKLFADTIKDPEEIWCLWVEDDKTKKPVIMKRYIKIYMFDNNKIPSYVAFDYTDSGWMGITSFQPKSLEYLDRQRVGKLMFKREKP